MKVLVIQPKIGMGDMVIYLPYIHAISKKNSTAVSLLVKKNSRANELLDDDKNINEIILLDRTKNNTGTHDGVVGFLNLIKIIKSKKFDKVYIFSNSLRYFLLAKFCSIKIILQYPLLRKNDNVVVSAKVFTENAIGEIVSTQPILNVNNDKILKAKKNFKTSEKNICLGFSASGPTKRWDVKNYIKLCEELNKKFPCNFLLAGGNNDKKLVELFLNSKIGKKCFSFSELNINETLPLIKNCDLYIGNDTGWLHISSALGLRCLGLFMDSPVMAYGKYSKNISIIIPEGETEESTTHDTLGKDKISYEKVFNKASELLN